MNNQQIIDKTIRDIKRFASGVEGRPIARSLWFENGLLKVYMRAGKLAVVDGTILSGLAISNVIVVRDKRTGVFSSFLDGIIALAQELEMDIVQVEQVHNEILAAYLECRGFTNYGSTLEKSYRLYV